MRIGARHDPPNTVSWLHAHLADGTWTRTALARALYAHENANALRDYANPELAVSC